jgi:hypothetical protein
MPQEVRKHIDDHIIGEWITETTWGETVTHGENRARWADGGQTVISQWSGESIVGDGNAYVTSVMGWDAARKMIVEYSVASNGEHWTYEWNGLQDAEWTGRGFGTFNGKEWSSTATVKWTADGSRYEDVTEGKPFVLTTRRKSSVVAQPKGETTVPEEVLKHFQFFVGEWTAVGTTSDGRAVNATMTFRWLPGNKALMFDADWSAGELKTLGSGIFGWEGAEQKVHTTEFWEAGGYNHRHYTIVSDRKWEGYQFAGINAEGQRLTQHITVEIKGPNEFMFVAFDRVVDGAAEEGTGTLTLRRK